MLGLANADDAREDLELAVLELQDRYGVAASSIRRFVNAALRAKAGPDGTRSTKFLRQRWNQTEFGKASRSVGNGLNRTETEPQGGAKW